MSRRSETGVVLPARVGKEMWERPTAAEVYVVVLISI
jgi:hypothetical protein